ncbi:hypothetical protein [Marinobacterium sedimentorum]|uniref:hypothetical protein n=1 Tax=Marinobacterium sedimentorum TaxID=2927804 RepID=UPI0020C74642|nr:hypothetical protein [Marinobacterium sedimentorum]
MMPTRAQLRRQEQQVLKARQQAQQAREQLRQSIRNGATSAPGLIAGFTLGLSIGRSVAAPGDGNRPAPTLHLLRWLLPLLRLL